MTKCVLQLFILGYTPVAKRAIKNLEFLCGKSEINALYTFKVVNLYDYPELAEKEKILATPLLVIRNIDLNMRIIGDLSNTEPVLELLTSGLTNHED